MKKELDPRITIAVIAVVALVAVGIMVYSWNGPSVRVSGTPNPNADPHRTKEQTQAMAQERRQDMMARRAHQPAANSGN